MSRTGKIARLPQNLRQELHHRLADGESGLDLVCWLNDQPAVKAVLQNHFQGHALTAQNLSEWRSGSHADWLREQAFQSRLPLGSEPQSDLDQLLNEASLSLESPPTPAPNAPVADLDHSSGEQNLTRLMARRLAFKMALLQEQRMDEEPDPRKKWKLACALNRELARIRRQDHRAAQRATAHDSHSSHPSHSQPPITPPEKSPAPTANEAPVSSFCILHSSFYLHPVKPSQSTFGEISN